MSNPKLGPSGRRSTRKRGQAMVEFALVLPIFMLILSGILDFGFALYSRMTVINAAREGARAAAMVSDVTTIPTVIQNRVISAAASAGLTLTASNVVVGCVQGNPNTTSPCDKTFSHMHDATHLSAAESGDSVSVTVHYTYHTFFPLTFGTSFDLSSTVQMVLDNATSG
ncbi:MAG: TadE family protein [Candidatus Limnocylindrales bacterium]